MSVASGAKTMFLAKVMLRKTNSQKGFTIIEVVITIAIGAAVMALVLNAVSGARRSQRNNARIADIGAIAAAVNQYYGARNSLPPDVAAFAGGLEDNLAYYPDGTTAIIGTLFPASAFHATTSNAAGGFTTWGGRQCVWGIRWWNSHHSFDRRPYGYGSKSWLQ